jgi:hypothetical protein
MAFKENNGFTKIPLLLFRCIAERAGGIQKLAAVLTRYGVVLNFFSAEGALFHSRLSRAGKRGNPRHMATPLYPAVKYAGRTYNPARFRNSST